MSDVFHLRAAQKNVYRHAGLKLETHAGDRKLAGWMFELSQNQSIVDIKPILMTAFRGSEVRSVPSFGHVPLKLSLSSAVGFCGNLFAPPSRANMFAANGKRICSMLVATPTAACGSKPFGCRDLGWVELSCVELALDARMQRVWARLAGESFTRCSAITSAHCRIRGACFGENNMCQYVGQVQNYPS